MREWMDVYTDYRCTVSIVWYRADDVYTAGGHVLIHCQAGVSRSSTFAIAYVMARSNLAMLDAFRFVKSRRPIVAPNFNFMGQLLEFETALKHARPGVPPRRMRTDMMAFIAQCQLNDPLAAADDLDEWWRHTDVTSTCVASFAVSQSAFLWRFVFMLCEQSYYRLQAYMQGGGMVSD